MGKKKKRFKWGRLRLVILAVVGINVLLILVNQQTSLSVQLEKQQMLTQAQQKLQHQLDYHTNELEFIGTDEYIEQAARERLGWLKPGEKKYMDSADTEEPHEKVSAEPTATPSVPGPRHTERPAGVTATPVATQRPTASPSASPDPTASKTEETSARTSEATERPKSTSTPKSIG